MGAGGPRPVVLDAGAFIAFEKNDAKVCSVIELALAHGGALHAPACVIAQVWRDGRRQARLARLLGGGAIEVTPLDRDEAKATGVLCGRSWTTDVVDASVVLLARRHRAIVLTSDPDDLARIDPGVQVAVC